jgi:arylsulfatase
MFNLYTNPREDEEKMTVETWILGPTLNMVAAFEARVKTYPLIPTGTPDPYKPPPAQP